MSTNNRAAPLRFSIRTKLTLAIAVPLLAFYALFLWLEFRAMSARALANMESHLTELAIRQAVDLDGDLRVAQQVAGSAAAFLTLHPGLSADEIETLLRATLRDNNDVFGMCAAFEPRAFRPEVEAFCPYFCRADADGAQVPPQDSAAAAQDRATPRSAGVRLRRIDIAAARPDFRGLSWYRPVQETGKPAWTEPYLDEGVSDRWMCTYSAPFRRDGRFRGLVTVDLVSTDLLRDIARVKIGSGYCMLISRSGAFISHPDETLAMHASIFDLAGQSGVDELAEVGRRMIAGGTGSARIRDYRTGEPKWLVYTPVPATQWSLAAIVPESEVLAPVHARMQRFFMVLVAGLAVIVGVVLLVSSRITRPLSKLAAAADALGHGDLDTRIADVRGSDEVARLAQRFNTMVGELKSNVEGRLREEASRRAMEGELRAAREIQASLLPPLLPDDARREFDLCAVNVPAKMVAGDFFDFFFLDDRRLAIVIADVSGKGIPAAVYMAVARTKLRDFTAPERTPAQVVAAVNRCLAEDDDSGMFLTLFFGYYDTRDGELLYANAGHCPPYVVRESGALEQLEPTGPIVAPFAHAEFHDARCRLEYGDQLFLFTDGVTEANGGTAALFGEERLEQLLREAASQPSAELCRAVVDSVGQFSRDDLKDDLTVLALRRRHAVLQNSDAGCYDASCGAGCQPV
jgi:phosphoserine phosphatase RsbU/P